MAVLATMGAVIATIPGMAVNASAAAPQRVNPIISGLNGPRGLDVAPSRRVVYSEADGTVSETILHAPKPGDGQSQPLGHRHTIVLGKVKTDGIAPAVAQVGRDNAYILVGGGSPESNPNTLYAWSSDSGAIREVADIGAYQLTDPDPYNQEGDPTESNAFGLAALPDGSALVSDAAGNDLLRVWPGGAITTVARLKPRVVLVPKELDGQPGVPPVGTPITAEGVATSVTVGADGAYYVGELRGFPATPGTSEVWRIDPDSENAVCDPDSPDTGACTRYADGLTSIDDLAAGPDGTIYALSLDKQSWLQWELGIADPIGGLYRISSAGAKPDLITSDQLTLPGGVFVTRQDKIWVTGPVESQSPGDGWAGRIHPRM